MHDDRSRRHHRSAGRRGGGGAPDRRGNRGSTQVAPVRVDSLAPLGGGDRGHRPRAVRPAWRPRLRRGRSQPSAMATRCRCGATAALVLADGTAFWGRGFGAHTADARAGGRGLLQHRHDRLSGDADRSVLCRADHHLHLPAYRQRRHQRRGHRGRHDRGPRSGGEAGHHRTVQLAVGRSTWTPGSGHAGSLAWPGWTRGR